MCVYVMYIKVLFWLHAPGFYMVTCQIYPAPVSVHFVYTDFITINLSHRLRPVMANGLLNASFCGAFLFGDRV